MRESGSSTDNGAASTVNYGSNVWASNAAMVTNAQAQLAVFICPAADAYRAITIGEFISYDTVLTSGGPRWRLFLITTREG